MVWLWVLGDGSWGYEHIEMICTSVCVDCSERGWYNCFAQHVPGGLRAFAEDHSPWGAVTVSVVICCGETGPGRPPLRRPPSVFGVLMPGSSSGVSARELLSLLELEPGVDELSSMSLPEGAGGDGVGLGASPVGSGAWTAVTFFTACCSCFTQ